MIDSYKCSIEFVYGFGYILDMKDWCWCINLQFCLHIKNNESMINDAKYTFKTHKNNK